MTGTIIEWAPIKLAAGRTEADLIAASDAFQRDFLSHQPGFVRRELVRRGEGEYVDIVHWRSLDDAKAIMAKVETSPACRAFFSVMDMDDADAAGCIDHFTSIAVYGQASAVP